MVWDTTYLFVSHCFHKDNSKMYQEVLDHFMMITSSDDLCDDNFVFQQTSTALHTSRSTKKTAPRVENKCTTSAPLIHLRPIESL